MITHLVKSINWIDVALALLFIRMIYAGVKNGFISEFFKTLGVVVGIFVSLHYYSYLAAWVALKTHLNWEYWNLLLFAMLWLLVSFFFRLVRTGVLLLFKAETTHEGFDKYAAGVMAVGRGLLVCSLTIFLILLVHFGPTSRMAFHSFSFKIAGHAASGTYKFLYTHLVDKLITGEHYNTAVAQVLQPPVGK